MTDLLREDEWFEFWITRALSTLRDFAGYRTEFFRISYLRETAIYIAHALTHAISLEDRARERVCLTVLGWLQEDIETITRSAA